MPLTEAYLALGSNRGARIQQMRTALRYLEKAGGLLVTSGSGLYENRAIGMGKAEPFLNGAVRVRTDLSPEELLERCLQVEERIGRVRTGVWGPRQIDIDILLYGDRTIDTDRLHVPHPGIEKRDFVVRPLLDLDAGAVVRGRPLAEAWAALDSSELKRIEDPLWPSPGVHVIVARSENGVIGRGGQLPWKIPEDWRVFLEKTAGGAMVIGKKSFFEIIKEPTWAEGRRYYVVTRERELEAEFGVTVVGGVGQALEHAEKEEPNRPVWICGGQEVYREALPHTDQIHLTTVFEKPEGDTFFPVPENGFGRKRATLSSSDDNHRYSFEVFEV